jgi:alpha-tubulin suppressor-like RCC1 family protein
MRCALLISLVCTATCTPVPRAFVCNSDDNCVNGTVQGHCEGTRFCSFADGNCPSGRRYGQYAGNGLGFHCVPSDDGGMGPGDMGGAADMSGDGGKGSCGGLDDVCCAGSMCNSGLSCVGGACIGCVTSVATGDAHTCALKADGSLWCWGKNDKGQLGNGTTNDALAPSRVVDSSGLPFMGAVKVVAGSQFTCVRKSDGSVACWGANDAGQLGVGANPTTTPYEANPQLVALSLVTDVGTGAKHACASLMGMTGTSLWCWGANDSGQIGPSGGATNTMPVQAVDKGNQPIKAIAVAGGLSHTCAIAPDHTLWCWGSDVDGELGDGAMAPMNTAVQVASLGTHVNGVTLGAHVTCALSDGNVVSCFGLNDHGQAGVPGGAPVAVPTALALPSLTRVALGAAHACARQVGGGVWCWGSDSNGQLGDSSASDSPTPKQVRGGAGAVAGGLAHSCAARADGLDCWGADASAQLGDGMKVDESHPVATLLTCP